MQFLITFSRLFILTALMHSICCLSSSYKATLYKQRPQNVKSIESNNINIDTVLQLSKNEHICDIGLNDVLKI